MNATANNDRSFMSLRIIVAAMMAGILAFGLVAVLLGMQRAGGGQLATILLLVLALYGVGEIPVYVILRTTTLAKLRSELQETPSTDDPIPRLLPTFMQLTIIAAAMAEGLGLFGLVIFLLTGAWPALIGPLIALAVLAVVFPTHDKLANFASNLTGRRLY